MLNFRWKNGVEVAEEDGLAIVLVREPGQLDSALQVVKSELADLRLSEPETSGELVLDPQISSIDIMTWARQENLSEHRISLHFGDNSNLESVAQQRFVDYQDALDWARQATNARQHGISRLP
jgi:hypothetical protein